VLRRALILSALIAAVTALLFTGIPICPMAGVLGVPCPGCGLTRATLSLLRGDVRGAFHLHPLVFVLSPLFSWAMLSVAWNYVRGPRPRTSPVELRPWHTARWVNFAGGALLVTTLALWGVRFLGFFGGPVPVETLRSWVHERYLGH